MVSVLLSGLCLACRGYINDEAYAREFTRSRFLSNSWGPQRIKQVGMMSSRCYAAFMADAECHSFANGTFHHIPGAANFRSSEFSPAL